MGNVTDPWKDRSLRPLDPSDHLLYKKGYVDFLEMAIQFKREVNDRSKDVDPSNEQDWFSLTLGWAIAKGLEPEDAHEFATYIRYDTDVG